VSACGTAFLYFKINAIQKRLVKTLSCAVSNRVKVLFFQLYNR